MYPTYGQRSQDQYYHDSGGYKRRQEHNVLTKNDIGEPGRDNNSREVEIPVWYTILPIGEISHGRFIYTKPCCANEPFLKLVIMTDEINALKWAHLLLVEFRCRLGSFIFREC